MASLIGKFVGIWLHPWDTMRALKEEGEAASIKSSMLFVAVMGLLTGLIVSIVGTVSPPDVFVEQGIPTAFIWLYVLIVPILYFVGSFINAFFIWAIVNGVLKGSAPEYKITYRLLALTMAFSPVSTLLGPIPVAGTWLSLAVVIWTVIVIVRGVIIVRETKPLLSWIIFLIIFLIMGLLTLGARLAAPPVGGFPAGEGMDLTLDDELFNEELGNLAEEARTGE